MKTSESGKSLIKEFEGFRSEAYLDPVGIPTIGFGFVEGVRLGDVMSPAEADVRLEAELLRFERAVSEATGGNANQNEFDAMVSFAFNVGVAGLKRSTVVKAHNRGDKASAARAFSLWNKAGGKVMAGLTRRRAAEAALYLKPVAPVRSDPADPLPMPQRVDGESTLLKSPIIGGSAVTAGASTLGLVAESARSARDIKESLGEALPWILVAILLASVFVMYWRNKQRKQGWS